MIRFSGGHPAWIAVFVSVALVSSVALGACSVASSQGSTSSTGGSSSAEQSSQASQVSFQGKTISLIVPFAAGGPTDVFARQFATYFSKHLPGNPTVIVQNMTGGGGVVGDSYIFGAAKKDGTAIGITSGAFARQVFAPSEVQYDMAKVVYLGGTQESHFTIMHSSAGVKSAEELAASNKQITVGGLAPTSSKDMATRLFAALLGKTYKYVTGYQGNADIKAGFLRGENNFYEESLTGYVANSIPLIEEGTAVPMGQRGLLREGKVIRDPRQKDVPTYQELAEKLRGAAITSDPDYKAITAIISLDMATFPIYYPPGVSAEIVEVVRQAAKAVFDDPEFKAETRKQVNFEHSFIEGEALQKQTADVINLLQADKATMDRLQELAKEQP